MQGPVISNPSNPAKHLRRDQNRRSGVSESWVPYKNSMSRQQRYGYGGWILRGGVRYLHWTHWSITRFPRCFRIRNQSRSTTWDMPFNWPVPPLRCRAGVPLPEALPLIEFYLYHMSAVGYPISGYAHTGALEIS
jgi:hypothetical protein